MRKLLALLVLVPAIAYATPEAEIHASFDRYKTAVLANDGPTAAKELDARTVHYYGQLRATALSMPDIHGIALLDKLIVLRLRQELTPDQLSSMDGRSLLAYAIGKRWVSAAQVAQGGLGKILVQGPRAEAAMTIGGKPTPMSLVYRKDPAGWRLDLTANNDQSQRSVEALRKKLGLSEDELAIRMVQEATGHPVPPAAWRPLLRR